MNLPSFTASLVALTLSGGALGAASLDVNSSALHTGNYGLEVVVTENSPAYVLQYTGNSLLRFNTRFYVDPSGLICGATTCELDLFEARSFAERIFRLSFVEDVAGARLAIETVLDDGSTAADSWPRSLKRWQIYRRCPPSRLSSYRQRDLARLCDPPRSLRTKPPPR